MLTIVLSCECSAISDRRRGEYTRLSLGLMGDSSPQLAQQHPRWHISCWQNSSCKLPGWMAKEREPAAVVPPRVWWAVNVIAAESPTRQGTPPKRRRGIASSLGSDKADHASTSIAAHRAILRRGSAVGVCRANSNTRSSGRRFAGGRKYEMDCSQKNGPRINSADQRCGDDLSS